MNKFILSIFLICFVNVSNAAVNFYEAQIVYKQICDANGINNAPPLVLGDTTKGAQTSPDHILISPDFLSLMRNDNDIAMVLGHELAHFLNDDAYNYHPAQWIEYRADAQGLKLIENAGYSHCKSIKWLLYLNKKLGSGAGGQYPSYVDRYKYLHKGCWF